MKKRSHSRKFSIHKHKKIFFIVFIILLLPIIFWASQYPQLTSSEGKTVTNLLKPLQSSSLSNSKIGVFFLGATGAGKRIVSGGPRVIKVIDPHQDQNIMQLVRDYKSAYPQGLVVMRVYEGDSKAYGLGDDPQNSARDFWQKVISPALNKMSEEDRKLIDFISAPNEYGNTPIVKNENEAEWSGRFWEAFAEVVSQNGFRPNIGEIPVGNWGPELIPAIIPALRKVKATGGVWSYHAYTLDYSTDTGTESWTSLRYRMFYDYLRTNYPDVSDIPMILTEGGVDKSGNGGTDGWIARGDSASFENWLTWYDSEIQKDPYILGVTLFQSGNSSDWKSFNIDSISDWLANYLGGQPAEVIPTTIPIPSMPTIFIIPTTVPAIFTPTTYLQPTTIQPTTYNPPPTTYIPSPTKIIPLPTTNHQPPTIIPTSTPAPLFDVDKTINTARSFWSIILYRLTQLSKVILP